MLCHNVQRVEKEPNVSYTKKAYIYLFIFLKQNSANMHLFYLIK